MNKFLLLSEEPCQRQVFSFKAINGCKKAKVTVGFKVNTVFTEINDCVLKRYESCSGCLLLNDLIAASYHKYDCSP